MTTRDPEHRLNPLPWEVPTPGRPGWRSPRFLYVLPRQDARLFLIATAHGLQEAGWPFPTLESRTAVCDAWWNLFFDLDPADQVMVGRELEKQSITLPDDPQAR